MIQLNTIAECKKWRKNKTNVALIPTMGALHDGHLSLITLAKKHAKIIIVSIFINPSQFGADEDFEKYPKQLKQDLDKLKNIGIDAIFTPSTKEMYPNSASTIIKPSQLAYQLCGKTRPNLFQGAATIVVKLINCCSPDYLIVGNKDYQQKIILAQVIADLILPCKIIGAEIKRNSSNLALSSRNQYLSNEQITLAANIFKSLALVKKNILENKSHQTSCKIAINYLTKLNIKVEYITIRNKADLSLPHATNKNLIVLIAAWINKTRLIDNLTI